MSLQQLGRERFEVCHKRKPLNVQRHQANMIAWWRRPLNRKLQFFSSQRCVRGLPQVSREPFCGWRVLEMCRPPPGTSLAKLHRPQRPPTLGPFL
jgi:hypothetical protein